MCKRLFVFSLLLLVLTTCSPSETRGKKILIARDGTWYPLNLMGKEHNMLGFIDELILQIAKQKNLDIELVFTSGNTIFVGLNNGSYDGAITSLAPTAFTSQQYLFSDPLYLLGPVLVVSNQSNFSRIGEMENRTIGIQRGSATAFDTVRFPHVTLHPYENHNFALEELAQNKIDGILMEAVPAFVYTQSFYKGKLRIATAPLTQLGLRLVTHIGSKGSFVMRKFNEGLIKAKEDGTYDELIEKWGLFNPEDGAD